jgi:CrcB protein
MRTIIFVASFGALGCVARYLLAGWGNSLFGGSLPYGTFAVNVIGSFLIGVVMEFSLHSSSVSQELRIGLAVGLLGGFTTFSAFSYETFRLLEDGLALQAMLYVFSSVIVCLVFTFAGIVACRNLM